MLPRTALPAMLAILMIGCDQSPREVSQPRDGGDDPRNRLARPDVFRMSYDPHSRVLYLYELPDDGSWMIATPWSRAGEPVSLSHQFRTEIDPAAVAVFYKLPGGQTSPRVLLGEIIGMAVSHNGP